MNKLNYEIFKKAINQLESESDDRIISIDSRYRLVKPELRQIINEENNAVIEFSEQELLDAYARASLDLGNTNEINIEIDRIRRIAKNKEIGRFITSLTLSIANSDLGTASVTDRFKSIVAVLANQNENIQNWFKNMLKEESGVDIDLVTIPLLSDEQKISINAASRRIVTFWNDILFQFEKG